MADLYSLYKASKQIEKRVASDTLAVTDRITADGGAVLDWGRVGVFLRSPSTSYKMGAIYYWFTTVYGQRRGTWYVITYDHNPNASEWFWKDEMGMPNLPVPPSSNEKVDNKISAITELSGNQILGIFLVIVLLVAGACVKIAYMI